MIKLATSPEGKRLRALLVKRFPSIAVKIAEKSQSYSEMGLDASGKRFIKLKDDNQPAFVYAHEFGHHEDNQTFIKKYIIDTIGRLGSALPWTVGKHLVGAANKYKERRANAQGLRLLKEVGASSEYLKTAETDYAGYMEDLKRNNYLYSDTP